MPVKRWRRKLRTRMVLSFLIVGIIPVILGMSVIYFLGNRAIERVIGANFKELAFETSDRVDNYIEHHLEEVHFLSLIPQIIDHVRESNSQYTGKDPSEIQREVERIDTLWEKTKSPEPISLYPGRDSSEIQKDMEAIWEKNPAKNILSDILNNKASKFMMDYERADAEEEGGSVHINILITDKKGVVVAATNIPDRFYYGGEKWWKHTYNDGDGQKYISDINLDRHEKVHTFDIGRAIIDKGETIGTIFMMHDVENFFKSVTHVKVGRTDHTMLASSDGTLLFCPIFPIKSHLLKKELRQAIFQDEAGWSITNADVHFPGRSINGFAPVKISLSSGSHNFGGNKWYVFTSQDPRETYAPINTLLKWIAASGLFGIVLLGLLVMYASRRIVKPIKMLHDGAELIGKGDLNYRLQIKSGDEIEELADKFNEMGEQLKSSYTDLEKKVKERTEELLKTNKDLAILFDITATVSKSLNMDEILSEVLKKILSAIGGGAGFICFLDEESGNLLMAAHEGLAPDLIKKNKSINVETYPYSRVVREGRPYISEDLSDDKKYKRSYISNKYSSLACIPLRSKNEVLGSFTIYSAESGIFSKVANLLESIGNQLGISIENAKLFGETEKFSRMKSEFVSHVSHELRTPLSSVKSAVEILLDYGEKDEKVQREFLNVINSEADRLTRLVNDTLDLTKIESGRVKWNFEPLDLGDIVKSSVKVVKAMGKLKHITLEINIPEEIPLIIGDRDKLFAVMTNLLNNAMKFTEKGEISVGIELVEGLVRVYVADTGKGIPKDDQKKIFEPFYQSTNDTEGKPRGTGLGLSICIGIIEKHKGKIWVKSQIRKGSTFYFTLPVAQPTQLTLDFKEQLSN